MTSKTQYWTGEDRISLIQKMTELLAAPELDAYTAVVMARRELMRGKLEHAVSHLAVDLDKFHIYRRDIYNFGHAMSEQLMDWMRKNEYMHLP
ncbi:TPA: hypothetical protein DF272_02065 [Candidatus Falkowbacteria bacterium]|nr:hypothetical protein [Candidatus Falkowbacteria bacterium]